MVSKMADLLTEWVFESDLVSKMADLLTEKGVRRARWGHLTRRDTEGLPQLGSRNGRPAEIRAGARREGAEGRSNPGGSKLRRAKNAARRTGSRGRPNIWPASVPLALIYRILGPGAKPSRHSRGT